MAGAARLSTLILDVASAASPGDDGALRHLIDDWATTRSSMKTSFLPSWHETPTSSGNVTSLVDAGTLVRSSFFQLFRDFVAAALHALPGGVEAGAGGSTTFGSFAHHRGEIMLSKKIKSRGLPVRTAFCSIRDYALPCPTSWCLAKDKSCVAPINWKGVCPTRDYDLPKMSAADKEAHARICDTPYPCANDQQAHLRANVYCDDVDLNKDEVVSEFPPEGNPDYLYAKRNGTESETAGRGGINGANGASAGGGTASPFGKKFRRKDVIITIGPKSDLPFEKLEEGPLVSPVALPGKLRKNDAAAANESIFRIETFFGPDGSLVKKRVFTDEFKAKHPEIAKFELLHERQMLESDEGKLSAASRSDILAAHDHMRPKLPLSLEGAKAGLSQEELAAQGISRQTRDREKGYAGAICTEPGDRRCADAQEPPGPTSSDKGSVGDVAAHGVGGDVDETLGEQLPAVVGTQKSSSSVERYSLEQLGVPEAERRGFEEAATDPELRRMQLEEAGPPADEIYQSDA
ncbi:unnamed protein product [Amoebophrya sp. A25]|nr:unnamed protein product [Amoebophrya sp. A25]|eukprot:GSA25T00013877001.1